MKLIFLDMDGVMNSIQSVHFFHDFMKLPNNWFQKYMPGDMEGFNHYEDEICPMAVSNMHHILKQHPDTRFVISSTWRMGRDEAWFEKLFRHIGMIGNRECSRCDGKGYYNNSTYKDGEYTVTGRGKDCTYCTDGVWKDPNQNTEMVIGRTPRLGTERGFEIQEWIDEHPEIMKDVTEFVIIDDDSDMVHFLGTKHFVHTDGRVGFDYRKMEEVDKIFDGFNLKYDELEIGVGYKMFCKSRDTTYFKNEEGKIFYLDENGEVRDGVHYYKNSSLFARAK